METVGRLAGGVRSRLQSTCFTVIMATAAWLMAELDPADPMYPMVSGDSRFG